jgi:hypothetical protein
MSDEARRLRCETGCRPVCATCGRMKAPVGRSAPMEMAGVMCDDECRGYRLKPTPCDLWPNEERSHAPAETPVKKGQPNEP